MSNWLERELARGLTRVTPPDALGERLGLVRPSRSEFRGAMAAVAAAVVLIAAGGIAAGRSTTLDLYRYTARDLAAARPVELASNQAISLVSWTRDASGIPMRCDGGTARPLPVRASDFTQRLAHHGGSEDRTRFGSVAGCGFCHTL